MIFKCHRKIQSNINRLNFISKCFVRLKLTIEELWSLQFWWRASLTSISALSFFQHLWEKRIFFKMLAFGLFSPPMRPRGNVVINLKIYVPFILEHRCKPLFSVHKLPPTRSSLEVNFASFLWIMHQWNKHIELQLSKSLKISNQSPNA